MKKKNMNDKIINQVLLVGAAKPPKKTTTFNNLDLDMRISDFKKKIFEKYNILPKFFYIIVNGKYLDYYQTFSDYNENVDQKYQISNGSILRLVIRGGSINAK